MQFLYGEDGMDATCIEEQYLDYLRMTPREFKVVSALRAGTHVMSAFMRAVWLLLDVP